MLASQLFPERTLNAPKPIPALQLFASINFNQKEFEEYNEETEAMGTVRRDPSLADNALLPGEACGFQPCSSAIQSAWVGEH